MNKAIALGLGALLCSGLASAQAPTPTPDNPAPKPGGTKTDEKAGTDENLQAGTGERPWAAGVTPEKQKRALAKFREGNIQLNDGLFPAAAKLYKEALKDWEHPAIYYN